MNLLPECILYTQDAELSLRVTGHLNSLAFIRHVHEAEALELELDRSSPTLLILDLFAADCLPMLDRIVRKHSDTIVLALGIPRSDPAIQAERLGVYAVENIGLDRQSLQSSVSRALKHLELVREKNALEAGDGFRFDSLAAHGEVRTQDHLPSSLPHFSRAFRHFDDIDSLLDSMVDGVASSTGVSRVGVFILDEDNKTYVFKAGKKCLAETRSLEVALNDPLARWMHIRAHLVSRFMLKHIPYTSERVLLKHSLDRFGAEVIVPLQGLRGLLGWLFVGHRITGVPFGETDLEGLATIGEHVSASLENALLYRELSVQKTLADTVLESVPIGIMAVGEDGNVRWLNKAAEVILDVSRSATSRQPAARIGSPLSDMLANCVRGKQQETPEEWVDPRTKRTISVTTRRLMGEEGCMGAIAIINDLTKEQMLKEKQENLERKTFWTELAAAMSHEIRNPLVAISTFAQLLPERYDDPEFRKQFSQLVAKEINRLNNMTDQINAFAHHPRPSFAPVDISCIIRKAVERAGKSYGNGIHMEASAEKGLPLLRGDEGALVGCLVHLIRNSMEALEGLEEQRIKITATRNGDRDGRFSVLVKVIDNGRGVPEDMREKLFSPFCTNKARGIGLGLPIVKRTIADHGGQVMIDSGDGGTTVSLVLPTCGAPGESALDGMTVKGRAGAVRAGQKIKA